MKGNPSLLVADEPSTVPSLSSSGPYELTEDESQLAQLMHISPESAAPPSASQLLYHDNHNDGNNTLQATTTRTSPLLSRLNNSPPPPPPPTVSIATIAGGSLLFVQVGLFWVSVMGGSSSSSSTSATAWFDVVLRVQVSWFRLALGTDATDTVLQRMNLGSILLSFLQTHQNAALVLVVLTCTVLPVLALIQQVVVFVQRHADFVAGRPGRQYRNYIDPLVRLSFLVVWLLLFMDLATSFIDLKWTGTVVSVQNRIQHGLVSYVLAATSMIAMAIVQRFGQDNIPTRRNTSTTEFSPYMMEDEDNMDTIREPLLPADGTTEQEATTTTTAAATRCNGKPCVSKIVPILAFETGLLSVLLLVASFFEPLLTIRYSGIASQFMNCREQSLHLGQLPVLLWERGNAAQTEKWVLLAFGMVLLQLTLGLPLAALVCAVHRWTGRTSRQSRLWLKSLYPGSGPLVLALALLLVVPLLDHVPQYLFEQDTSSATLCDHVETLLDESCLVLKSQLGAGAWCFIAHSVLLEAFLLLSLR